MQPLARDFLRDALDHLGGWTGDSREIRRTLPLDEAGHAALAERVKVHADAMQIRPDIRRAEGATMIRLRSGDGGITLRLPDDLSADLDAHTGDGSIDLDLQVTVSGAITSSTVRGKLGAGGPPLKVQTGDGSIHLRRL